MRKEEEVLQVLHRIESNQGAWPKFVTMISHEIGADAFGDEDICISMRVRKDALGSMTELARELNAFDAQIRKEIFSTGTSAWPSFRVTAD